MKLWNEIDSAGEREAFFETAMGQNVDGALFSSVWGVIHDLMEDLPQCKKWLLDITTVKQSLGKNISRASADASMAVGVTTRAQSSVSAWQATMQSTNVAEMARETKKVPKIFTLIHELQAMSFKLRTIIWHPITLLTCKMERTKVH